MLFDSNNSIFAFTDKEDYLINMMKYKNNSKVLSPSEALIIGNAFKDSYKSYKDYQPDIIKPKNEMEACLLKVQELCFMINELNLYLDVNPHDMEIYELFKKYVKEYEDELHHFEKLYEPLLLTSDLNNKYEWYKNPWPWEKRGNFNV